MVLRSVDVVLQNSTPELLTLEGFALLKGDWGPPGPPRRGDVVEKQASGKWLNQSTQEGVGASGYLRLGSTKGYIELSWNLPFGNAGDLTVEVGLPEAFTFEKRINKENGDAVAILITLRRQSPPQNRKQLMTREHGP